MEFIRIYICYVKLFFKARREFRVNFLLGILANFITYFFVYATYWIITNSLNGIDGWDFSDLTILYGLSLFTYAVAGTLIWYSVYNLSEQIIKGTLDVLLTRPLGIFKQLVCNRFGDTFIGQMIVTIVFVIAAFYSKSTILSEWKLVYLVFSIVGGICLQMGGMICVGAISFWTLKSEEIGSLFYYSLREVTQYPLSIFPVFFQRLLTFVFPWAFINYYPSLLLLGKATTKMEYVCGFMSPFLGIFFLWMSLIFFRLGLRHYSGVGN